MTELGIAFLIALRPISPRLSALGSALAIPLFLTTLSFLFTLPGWGPILGFPVLGAAGVFLVKDPGLFHFRVAPEEIQLGKAQLGREAAERSGIDETGRGRRRSGHSRRIGPVVDLD